MAEIDWEDFHRLVHAANLVRQCICGSAEPNEVNPDVVLPDKMPVSLLGAVLPSIDATVSEMDEVTAVTDRLGWTLCRRPAGGGRTRWCYDGVPDGSGLISASAFGPYTVTEVTTPDLPRWVWALLIDLQRRKKAGQRVGAVLDALPTEVQAHAAVLCRHLTHRERS